MRHLRVSLCVCACARAHLAHVHTYNHYSFSHIRVCVCVSLVDDRLHLQGRPFSGVLYAPGSPWNSGGLAGGGSRKVHGEDML